MRFGTSYTAELDDVWMIGFEDLNLGDADFDDLVAVVSRPQALNLVAAPLPGAGLLLFSGLVTLIGSRVRRSNVS